MMREYYDRFICSKPETDVLKTDKDTWKVNY